ncbi:BZ3500_MvSof-1268-A1-R1_Chr9g10547 [Microbotryum saponariae]|uniref:BZ3500_MvSof-1268-A1-R1_Chr9g10547 protein n=1 Tax=Microbotryum saponariae TaxID=289078 RepID=A0A2X0MEI4_9BASI|nr:BZ3501_MvSof-1269-A2-R1_Chr9g10296 [Microbotryum saponariae]SDA00275.1 BZ3500_MvSof-1268-A1-R1_Chr9g10547 [Microbotryum saponariae]
MLRPGPRSLWTIGFGNWSPSHLQAGCPGFPTLTAFRFASSLGSSTTQTRTYHPSITIYRRKWTRPLPLPLLPSGLAQRIHSARPPVSALRTTQQLRGFHTTRPHRDVLFVSVPAFKSALLTVVRVSLIFLPVAWRWGMFKRFPKGAWRLGGIPLVATCLVLALGLNHSDKTARWRLLLMSEREELAWSNTRFEETISNDQCVLMPPEDPRVEPVRRVIERLVQTLNDDAPLSFAQYLQEEMGSKVGSQESKRSKIVPSARIEVANMPWIPETSNPEKKMKKGTWDLYCIDLPKINAFVLSSKDFFVYSGLLSLVEDDENLLAAVLAHECVHLTERHSVEELGFLALSGVVFDVLRGTAWALTLSFPMVGDALSAFFTFVDRKVGQRAYSRKLETEADELGLELMARAGFDPRASITLWEILNEVEQDVQERGEHGKIVDHIALLRTHPSSEQRLDNLKKHLPAAIQLYEHTLREKEGQLAAEHRIREQEAEHHRIQQEEDEQRRAAAAAARKATGQAREGQQQQKQQA